MKTYTCQICKEVLTARYFHRSELISRPSGVRRSSGRCKKCKSLDWKKRRQNNKDFFIRHKYRGMVSTCKRRERPLPTFTVIELVNWTLDGKENEILFNRLFANWKKHGHLKKDSPSFDRQDPTRGYELDNLKIMRWEMNLEKFWNYDSKVFAQKRRNDFFGESYGLFKKEDQDGTN